MHEGSKVFPGYCFKALIVAPYQYYVKSTLGSAYKGVGYRGISAIGPIFSWSRTKLAFIQYNFSEIRAKISDIRARNHHEQEGKEDKKQVKKEQNWSSSATVFTVSTEYGRRQNLRRQ